MLDKEKSGGSSDPEFIDVCAYGKGPLVHFCDQLGKFPVIVDICEPIAKGDDTWLWNIPVDTDVCELEVVEIPVVTDVEGTFGVVTFGRHCFADDSGATDVCVWFDDSCHWSSFSVATLTWNQKQIYPIIPLVLQICTQMPYWT